MRHQVGRHAGAVVPDAESRAAGDTARLAARHRQPHAGTERGGQLDLAVGRVLADRLGGVLHEVEEHLDELVAVGEHRRQRGIVFLDELDVAGEAGLREPLHVVEHDMDVDRLALDRPLVGEHLHAVDQLHDAVGLVADQLGQRAVARRCADCSSSCAAPRMPDSGFLISCASMAASAITERAAPRWVSCRSILSAMVRSCSMTTTWPAYSGSGATWRSTSRSPGLRGVREIDLVFVDRRAARAHLLDQREQRRAERHQIAQHVPAQQRHRGFEELLRPRHWRRRSCRPARP